MKVGERGKNLFKEWEGLRTHKYLDSANKWTIGIGHLITPKELATGLIRIKDEYVRYENGLTEQQCWDLLEQDLSCFERAVNKEVKVPLTQNQFDALTSFAFNVGITNFWESTLLRLLNKGEYEKVPDQLKRWNKAGGKVVAGLINRRDKEIALWLNG